MVNGVCCLFCACSKHIFVDTTVTANISNFFATGKAFFEVQVLKELTWFQKDFKGVNEFQKKDTVLVPNQA